MFSLSEEEYAVRCVNYIGDGDCKNFLSITKNNPYSILVSKTECMSPIQKIIASRLQKLKTGFRGKKIV